MTPLRKTLKHFLDSFNPLPVPVIVQALPKRPLDLLASPHVATRHAPWGPSRVTTDIQKVLDAAKSYTF